MRIAKTTDGRYIKVLGPEMQGLIGRLYDEIKDRKEVDKIHGNLIENHDSSISMIKSKVDMLLIRYSELSNTLELMFPEDEDTAVIDRPLVVEQSVEAQKYISSIVNEPPLTVMSTLMVTNLNAEMIGGMKASDFAPASHVGAGGSAHPSATSAASGFMSKEDKTKLDGFSVGATAPVSPVLNHIWIDTN